MLPNNSSIRRSMSTWIVFGNFLDAGLQGKCCLESGLRNFHGDASILAQELTSLEECASPPLTQKALSLPLSTYRASRNCLKSSYTLDIGRDNLSRCR